MEGTERRDLYNGFGTTFTRAFELVVTALLFALGGRLLDGRLDTDPLFTVALAILGIVGGFLRAWFAYVEAMKADEAAGPWRKH